MKHLMKNVYIMLSIGFLIYLSLPNPDFPDPPPGSVQSSEPADIETPLRRSYFSNLDRAGIIANYEEQMKSGIFNNGMFTLRLNYPPEEAQVLIRDQARSSYLEEIVHPFRGSIYINGYEPKDDKDIILLDGEYWRQKVTVRQVYSSIAVRLLLGLAVVTIIPFLITSLIVNLITFMKSLKNIWIYR